MNVQPFKVHIREAALQDLREPLERTRWPDEIPNTGWEYGTNLAYLKGLVHYWQTQFDWRAQEKMMNQFAHFRANLDGFNIHFIHERGKGPDPLPIIIMHGWPSSFLEMLKIIPLLTDPGSHGGKAEDSFDVVVPSLPPRQWAERWLNIMRLTEMPHGGHFAAMEEPKLLAEDIITFLRPLRSQKGKIETA